MTRGWISMAARSNLELPRDLAGIHSIRGAVTMEQARHSSVHESSC